MTRKWTDEDLLQAFEQAGSIAHLLEMLELTPVGGNYATVKKHLKRLGKDPSLISNKVVRQSFRNLSNVFVEGSTVSNQTIKLRIYRNNLLPLECSCCKLTEWQGHPISLELDHINGCSTDNRIENLRFLCPNCHSLTPTYKGRNIGTGNVCKSAKQRLSKGREFEGSTPSVPTNCVDCDIPITRGATRCLSCRGIASRKINWPNKATIRSMVAKTSYRAVARKLGVSDNAVRKRLLR